MRVLAALPARPDKVELAAAWHHRAVNRPAAAAVVQHADHGIDAVRATVGRLQHIHMMIGIDAVVRRDIAVPVAVDEMNFGCPQLPGIRLALLGAEDALAVLTKVMNVVRPAHKHAAVGAVYIVIPILKTDDKGVCAAFGNRVSESLGHIYLIVDIIVHLLV